MRWNFAKGLALLLMLLVGSLAVAEKPVYLNLVAADIQDVAIQERTAWLKLTPAASEAFMQLTQANQGRWLEISVEGMSAMTIRIFTAVDSGTVQISRPSPELRERLVQIQALRSAAE